MKYIKKFEIDNGSSVEEYIPIPPIATSEVTGGIKASLRTEENVEAAIDENGSLFVPEYPNLDNKINKNGYSEEDYGKVLGTDNEGNVVLKEVKSASDNNPIGIVEKTLNPSVSDCFNSSIKNLKLYGQSTQGADPSPTNKQDITAISQFEGAPTGGNLLNPEKCRNKEETWEEKGITFTKNSDGSFHAKGTANKNVYIVFNNIELYEGKYYKISINNNKFYIRINGGQSMTSTLMTNTVINRVANKTSIINNVFITVSQNLTVDDDIYFMLEESNTDVNTSIDGYTPYVAQPFTYIPTQKMYSTQDGSICDYVDVEKGVEVYNMGVATDLAQKSWEINSQNDEFIKFQLGNYPLMNNVIDNPILCNMFMRINISQTDLLNQEGIAKGSNGYILQIVLSKSRGILTVEDFKAFIQEIIVVYPLATPTEIPIPQEQLQMLRSLYTYNGVTNFLCNAPVSFKYEQSLQIIIDNILKSINNVNANTLLLQGGI